MSSLNDQLNSFKKKVKSAPVLQRHFVTQKTFNLPPPSNTTSQKRDNSSLLDVSSPSSSNIDGFTADGNSPKRKKSNPAKAYAEAMASNSASGRHLNTQVVDAVEYIKRADKPVPFEDVARYLSTNIDSLLPRMLNIDRIHINMVQKTAQYVSIFGIYTKEDLLTFLRRQETCQGISVKQLKDGWNGCLAAIEELEQGEQIIVVRTKKENSPRFVWANTGGSLGGIDAEFMEIWSKVKVPDAADLPTKLEEAGLKPTSVDPATIKSNKKAGGDRKQKKPRRGKITNTHLGGLLKDYGA